MFSTSLSKGEKKEIICEIEQRIQFLVLVVIFISGLFYNFFNKYAKYASEDMVLNFSVIVVIYFSIYFLFEITKNKISDRYLKILNTMILVGIGFFMIPILFLGLADKLPNSSIVLLIYKLGLWGVVLIIPAAILFILAPFIFAPKKK